MPNPFPPGSPHALDYAIWARGRDTGGDEAAFVNALHEPATLHALRDVLQAQAKPGYVTRVSSVRPDNALVVEPLPKPKPKRELGDLAIVVTRVDRALLRRRMWMVQAKVAARDWPTRLGGALEVDLYERRPEFELLTSTHPQAKSLGRYALAQDFPRVANDALPFWSYVLFAEAGADGEPVSMPPVRHQWPAAPAQCQASFADGVLRMVKGIGIAVGHGADVDAQAPQAEWRKLFRALWCNGTWRDRMYYAALSHVAGASNAPVRFATSGFGGTLAPDDAERFRRLASADDGAPTPVPAAPEAFAGPADGPRMPMLLVDQVLATVR